MEQTIGQAYEEMQTQNSRLIQQITERDDYNTQVTCQPLCILVFEVHQTIHLDMLVYYEMFAEGS